MSPVIIVVGRIKQKARKLHKDELARELQWLSGRATVL